MGLIMYYYISHYYRRLHFHRGTPYVMVIISMFSTNIVQRICIVIVLKSAFVLTYKQSRSTHYRLGLEINLQSTS